MKLKVLDLFSGIGGFSLGLHSTGIFETIKFVEKDIFCKKVLIKNFPNIPIEEDIKNVKGQEFEADVITGGFPCQPMSVAGKQKGTNDDRYLWPEMFRLIKEIKPEFVIGENVQGIINIQQGMVLRQVLNDLEGEGFEVQCFLIPAAGIGAWHQRYRVWIVGHSKHNGLLATEKRSRDKKINGGTQKGQNETIKSERTSGSRDNENVSNTEVIGTGEPRNIDQEKGNQSSSSTQSNRSSKDVPNTERNEHKHATIGQSGVEQIWGFYSEEEKQTAHDLRSKTSRCDGISGSENVTNTNDRGTEISTEGEQSSIEMLGGQSQKTWWQIESDICGIPNGLSYELDKDRANRIKSLGNAIVPQIARELGLAIKTVLINEK